MKNLVKGLVALGIYGLSNLVTPVYAQNCDCDALRKEYFSAKKTYQDIRNQSNIYERKKDDVKKSPKRLDEKLNNPSKDKNEVVDFLGALLTTQEIESKMAECGCKSNN